MLPTHSPSLRKAYLSNPRPTFSNCIQSDFTMVLFCLMTFRNPIRYPIFGMGFNHLGQNLIKNSFIAHPLILTIQKPGDFDWKSAHQFKLSKLFKRAKIKKKQS